MPHLHENDKNQPQSKAAANSPNFQQERIASCMPPQFKATAGSAPQMKENGEEKVEALQKKENNSNFAGADAPITPPDSNIKNNAYHAEPRQFKAYQPFVQRKAVKQFKQDKPFQLKKSPTDTKSQGGLPQEVQAKMENSMGHDFSNVNIHKNSRNATDAGALAYAQGNDVHFAPGQFKPDTTSGQELIGHELAHVVQQREGRVKPTKILGKGMPVNDDPRLEKEADNMGRKAAQNEVVQNKKLVEGQIIENKGSIIQRTIGDGHDLNSPRFSGMVDLEATYDGESSIKMGDKGRGVQAIQHSLYDIGVPLTDYGADGSFGGETKTAVEEFQNNNSLTPDGIVGSLTMTALDARFGAPALPSSANLSAPWTPGVVNSILCPWSPHTIDVLASRITLKSFDSISWADEEWNGTSWTANPFAGGGYNTGTEIGILNSDNESVAEILYHEVLHAEQPTSHGNTLEKESYAYRIGEEFSIGMGLGGMPNLRTTDSQGREFADSAKVETFVQDEYPSVPSGGGNEQIIGKATTLGNVRVQRENGSFYVRPALVGESVPGPISLTNEQVHPKTVWACP